jgi:hypothetical protein
MFAGVFNLANTGMFFGVMKNFFSKGLNARPMTARVGTSMRVEAR